MRSFAWPILTAILPEEDFDDVITMLSEGIATSRGCDLIRVRREVAGAAPRGAGVMSCLAKRSVASAIGQAITQSVSLQYQQ
jgi:hypothetical protein